MLAVLLSLACFFTLPGSVEMGDECSESAECAGEGTCLKGVCAGYSCEGGCDNGHECASVAGVQVCALPCEADADCPGSMACGAWDEGSYCL